VNAKGIHLLSKKIVFAVEIRQRQPIQLIKASFVSSPEQDIKPCGTGLHWRKFQW
jgi:hypothetical protein